MNKLTVSASPQISSKNTTRGIMLDVIIALMPALIAATFFFGYLVIVNVAVCIIGCVASELVYCLIMSKQWNKSGVKKSSVKDLSCIVTAIILALNLPTYIDVWGMNIVNNGVVLFSFDTIILCLLGSIFSIAVVKMLFGGIGKNFANPALMGRIFLMAIGALVTVQTIGMGGMDVTTGATWLGQAGKPTNTPNLFWNMFIGNEGSAAVGETSVLALLIGFAYLIARKVIDPRVPVAIIASTAVFALIFDGLLKSQLSGAALINNMLGHILSGGLVFGAIFMATDYATSPNTFVGKMIFAVGISLFTMLIRVYAAFPEGMSFAIIIMNLCVPIIDKYIIPVPFGGIKPKKVEVK